MAPCTAIKGNGERCRGIAKAGSDYCPAHDPKRVEARRRSASKAAKSKPNPELRAVKTLCEDLTRRVLSGDVLPGVGAVVNQIANTRLRAVEVERRIREQDELLERIERLEEQATEKGGRRWGA